MIVAEYLMARVRRKHAVHRGWRAKHSLDAFSFLCISSDCREWTWLMMPDSSQCSADSSAKI